MAVDELGLGIKKPAGPQGTPPKRAMGRGFGTMTPQPPVGRAMIPSTPQVHNLAFVVLHFSALRSSMIYCVARIAKLEATMVAFLPANSMVEATVIACLPANSMGVWVFSCNSNFLLLKVFHFKISSVTPCCICCSSFCSSRADPSVR